MSKKLTEGQIIMLAKDYRIDVPALKAVIEVESSGSGFFLDWNAEERIKIQFEPHIFIKEAKKLGITLRSVKVGKAWYVYNKNVLLFANGVDNQKPEWDTFNKAWKISPEASMLATSWGMGQVMGFNYILAGFKSVGDMVTAFKESEANQVKGMLDFIVNSGLMGHLRTKNWTSFARGYNGKNFAALNYHNKLAASYNRHNK